MSSRLKNSRRRASTVDGPSNHNIISTDVHSRPMTASANQGTSQPPSQPATKRLSLPLPHPYQPYTPTVSHQYHTSAIAIPATHPQPEATMSALSPAAPASPAVNVNADPADPKYMTVQHTYYVHHHYYNHPAPPHTLCPNPPQNPPPASHGRTLAQRFARSTLVRRYRRVIYCLLFLPLPPLLSVLYIVIGHSLLRRASPSPSPSSSTSHGHSHSHNHDPWAPSLLSSANAAATGGAILALPLFLALYVVLPSSCCAQTRARARTPRDDFFEDDEEGAGGGVLVRVWDAVGYVACAVVVICVGGAAGALGVACLGGAGGSASAGNEQQQRQRQGGKILTPGRAAEAGIVGAAVLIAAVLVSAVLGVLAWWVWISRGRCRWRPVVHEKN
ncbi:hypothetical protein C0992_007174 [Termitomyces sp. T32_za158]|nr:hypothetical protein C0992_007174 [Termitomyces sp. T32_za158]